MNIQSGRTSHFSKFIAIAMLTLAVILSVYVLNALTSLWDAPESIGMVKYFTELPQEYLQLKTPKGNLEFPPITPIVIGVFFCICVLSGVLSLIKLLITLACSLLQPRRAADAQNVEH